MKCYVIFFSPPLTGWCVWWDSFAQPSIMHNFAHANLLIYLAIRTFVRLRSGLCRLFHSLKEPLRVCDIKLLPAYQFPDTRYLTPARSWLQVSGLRLQIVENNYLPPKTRYLKLYYILTNFLIIFVKYLIINNAPQSAQKTINTL